MKQLTIYCFLIFIFNQSFSQENIKQAYFESNVFEFEFSASGIKQTDQTKSLLQRMEAYGVPGVSIALINNNEIAWTGSYGVKSEISNVAVDESSIFQAASVSKFVTSIIVLHLVEKGILELDVNVNKYLSSWIVPENEYTKDNPVTLRLLLSHQSGLASFPQFERDLSKPPPSLQEILSGTPPALNPPAEIVKEQGQSWAYSNIGFALVQLILEDVTGKSLQSLAKMILFKPLGMKSSQFGYPLPKKSSLHEVFPHLTDGTQGEPDIDNTLAVGGLMTTPSDMAKILIEINKIYHDKKSDILSKETLAKMITPQTEVPPQALGLPLSMGLGVFIDLDDNCLALLHPGHNSPGTVFIIYSIPDMNQGVVIGANGNIGDRLYMEIIASLAHIYNWPRGQYFK